MEGPESEEESMKNHMYVLENWTKDPRLAGEEREETQLPWWLRLHGLSLEPQQKQEQEEREGTASKTKPAGEPRLKGNAAAALPRWASCLTLGHHRGGSRG